VRLGLHSGGQVELLDGVQAGDSIVTGATTVQPGQRLRAKAVAQ
jgi:hypothetical protein